MKNDKWLRRQQIKYNYYTVSLDSPVYNDDEDRITLAETIEEKHSEEDYQHTFTQTYLLLYIAKTYIITSDFASVFSFAVNPRIL